MVFLLLTFFHSPANVAAFIPAVQLARIKLRSLWILDITQSIFDTNISLFFKVMGSSELKIELSTTRTLSWALFQFTLSSEQSCTLTTGLKLTSSSQQKDPSVLPLLLCGVLQQQSDNTNEEIIIYYLACATAWQTRIDCKTEVNASV